MSTQRTPGPKKARYKVEHFDTRGVWVPLHRGLLRSHKSAQAKKQAFCRILVDYLGNGVWEEIETLPHGNAALADWDAEKRGAIAEAARSVAQHTPLRAAEPERCHKFDTCQAKEQRDGTCHDYGCAGIAKATGSTP